MRSNHHAKSQAWPSSLAGRTARNLVELQRQFLALRRAGALLLQAWLERRGLGSCALPTHRKLPFVYNWGVLRTPLFYQVKSLCNCTSAAPEPLVPQPKRSTNLPWQYGPGEGGLKGSAEERSVSESIRPPGYDRAGNRRPHPTFTVILTSDPWVVTTSADLMPGSDRTPTGSLRQNCNSLYR